MSELQWCKGDLCRHEHETCRENSPSGCKDGIAKMRTTANFGCCRALGHEGNHVACGATHNYALWEGGEDA